MRVEPRQRILHLWQAVARHSFRDGSFVWGAADAGDSIRDAEQLLCILSPATELAGLRLDRPGETGDDAVAALRLIGDRAELPVRLVHAAQEYLTRYRDDEGHEVFHAGTYLDPAQPNLALDVVESFAVNIRLTLAIMGFCRVLRQSLKRPALTELTHTVEQQAGTRLTAAMVGLLRGFAVHTFRDDTPAGGRLRETISQEHRAEQAVLDEFGSALREVRAGMREATIGIRDLSELDDLHQRFECGWSWALVASASKIETFEAPVRQPPGVAATFPHLYSTLIALQAIEHLFTQRTRILGLLTEDQQRLARSLQLRWDLTLTYWSVTATFGGHRWPLERLPWRTTAGDESDYNTLIVATITAIHLGVRRGNRDRGSSDLSFGYLFRVLAELAKRQRIVRPPLALPRPTWSPLMGTRLQAPVDPAAVLPPVAYHGADLPPMLFHGILRAASGTNDADLHHALDELADLTWDHLFQSAEAHRPVELRMLGDGRTPNWHNVLQIVDGLTVAITLTEGGSRTGTALVGVVHQLLAEADALFADTADRRPAGWATIESRLSRARKLADQQPARAAALLYRTLADLDTLTEPGERGNDQAPS